MQQAPVATKVQLASANTANRHANIVKLWIAINGGRATRSQRLDPTAGEFLIHRHQFLKILFGEGTSHRSSPRQYGARSQQSCHLEKITPVIAQIAVTSR